MLKYMLLVDEDEYEHLFFQWAIDKFNHNFRLLSAMSGKEGIQIFRKIKPVVAFINFQLYDMDGIKCLHKIKSIKGAENIPVYIYYRQTNGHLMRNAEIRGAAGCLAKFDVEHGLKACLYKTLTETEFVNHSRILIPEK